MRDDKLTTDYRLWIEAFVLWNFAGLVLDIFLAHSENQFRRESEYVPLLLAMFATAALTAVVPLRHRRPAIWRAVGHAIGWLAIGVGIAGVVLHLDSQFFYERTIRSLTYAAPFAAPLAYTGLGLLLIMNRLVEPDAPEWSEWVLVLTLGGFIGNFVFSLTDHAQNGFFNAVEWLPVASSAAAVGFLAVPFVMKVGPSYYRLAAWILAVQALVGVVGFGFHAAVDLRDTGSTVLERILSGPPPLAPMLFPNLALLGMIGLRAEGRCHAQST